MRAFSSQPVYRSSCAPSVHCCPAICPTDSAGRTRSRWPMCLCSWAGHYSATRRHCNTSTSDDFWPDFPSVSNRNRRHSRLPRTQPPSTQTCSTCTLLLLRQLVFYIEFVQPQYRTIITTINRIYNRSSREVWRVSQAYLFRACSLSFVFSLSPSQHPPPPPLPVLVFFCRFRLLRV